MVITNKRIEKLVKLKPSSIGENDDWSSVHSVHLLELAANGHPASSNDPWDSCFPLSNSYDDKYYSYFEVEAIHIARY